MNNIDRNLHDALNALHAGCLVGNRQRECRQIFLALQWFNLAEFVEEFDQPHTQLLQQSVAFEALLDTPKEGILEYFRKTVGLLIGIPDLDKWAKEFYKVRSQIVHGSIFEPKAYMYGEHRHVPHYDVAKAVFVQCLRKRLQLWSLYDMGPINTFGRAHDIQEMLQSNRARLTRIQALMQEDLTNDDRKRQELSRALVGLREEDRSLRSQDLERLRQCVTEITARRDRGELQNISEDDLEDVGHFLDVAES